MFSEPDCAPTDQPAGLGGAQQTGDGGAGTGRADLWATYAAIRTLSWLGLSLPLGQKAATLAYLRSRRNPDGGFAWQRGLASDAWATFYCCQAIHDLGETPDDLDLLIAWLVALQAGDGGFGMMPGQASDVWATYYAARTFEEIARQPVPDRAGLIAWLRELQLDDGSLTWCPGHREGDIRAFYYASSACRAADIADPPWRPAQLLEWVRSQQRSTGAFAFSADQLPCIWATFRATGGMHVWDWEPGDRSRCLRWLDGQLDADGFKRWDGYAVSDVWANFCGVGALRNLGEDLERDKKAIVARAISDCALPSGGYTYRAWPEAGDALSTAANAIVAALHPEHFHVGAVRQLGEWLRRAQMAAERGVMYMPARGAELRCTLWAHSALALLGGPNLDMERVQLWLGELQNPDGGFGYWLGRGSDMTSTACAAALLAQVQGRERGLVARAGLQRFVENCVQTGGAANLPGGPPTARSSAQAARIFAQLGLETRARALADGLVSRQMMGGFCNTERSLPDLHTTYECALVFQRLGLLSASLRRGIGSFLRKLNRLSGAIGWTPLSQADAEALALPLFLLLDKVAGDAEFELPELSL